MERRERDLDKRRFSQPIPEEVQPKPPLPAPPSKGNSTGSPMPFILAFIILLFAIVGAAVVVSQWVSVTAIGETSIIIIGALLAWGIVGAIYLRINNHISEGNFLKLMIESYKRFPLLKGKR